MVPYISYKDVLLKGTAASFMIALGVAVLLTQPIIGAFLFALGLFVICEREFFLFTGKCGYTLRSYFFKSKIIPILIVNVISGWLIGYVIGICNPGFTIAAIDKITTWSPDYLINFLQAAFCGAIMFLAVDTYTITRRRDKIGIFFGVPIFIFCGFQHCIANSIILGIAGTFEIMLFIHILGNWIGSIIIGELFMRATSGY